MVNPYKMPSPDKGPKMSEARQSAGILDDYAVRKVVYTQELIVNGSKVSGVAGISTGAGAPATAPTQIGNFYIDTTSFILYVAMGTSAASDWKGVLTQ